MTVKEDTNESRIKATRDRRIVDALANKPRLASRKEYWRGAILEEHAMAPTYVDPLVMKWHFLAMPITPVRIKVGWRLDGRDIAGELDPGTVTIHAAGDQASIWWKQYTDAVIVSLDPDCAGQQFTEDVLTGGMRLPSILSVGDPILVSLLHVLHSDLKAGHPSGKLFGECVLQSLNIHLAHTYSSTRMATAGSLPPRIVRQACEYIETHLATPLSLAEISQSVQFSPYHLNRTFRKATGQSLWAYVLHRRIERSRELMRLQRLSLLQISQMVGFETYGQFIAAFRRQFGVNPGQFRREVFR